MSTTISVIGETGSELNLSNSVSPSLDSGDWSNLASSVPNRISPTKVLEFNRNDGIKDDKTWIFTTAFTIDDIPVKLQEKVTGTALGSTMWQEMTAGTTTTGFVDTNDSRAISFTGKSGAKYSLSWDLSMSDSGYMNIQYTVMLTQPAYVRTEPVMDQIETVVYLMLENRSLDNVLGWLYKSSQPVVVYPTGSAADFNGIPASASNSWHENSYSPANIKVNSPDYGEHPNLAYMLPAFDPYEPIDNVQKQLYADNYGNMPSGYFWANTPPMTGFAWDYYESYIKNPGQVMGAYNTDQLPVLYGLARNFAVSDRWFSSIPTQTDPNRAFSLIGTSLGHVTNSTITEDTFANSNTIFNALGSNGKTWGFYWQSDTGPATGAPAYKPFTPYYFPQMNSAPHGKKDSYANFLTALKSPEGIPNFCYLEPYWGGGIGDILDQANFIGIQGNDYHPPAWIGPAEDSLNELYTALRASPQWSKMLIIITFDEHGGTYDHVPPSACLSPDSNMGPNGFKFDRLGVRVPAILISPYIEAGTVFRAPTASTGTPQYDLDHTSLIATLLKWAGVDPDSANMGARVSAAPTFEGVLSDTARPNTGPGSPPMTFSVPAGYKSQGGGLGAVDPRLSLDNPLDVTQFREAVDNSKTPEELVERLKALTSYEKK